jgi:hypothetical protein
VQNGQAHARAQAQPPRAQARAFGPPPLRQGQEAGGDGARQLAELAVRERRHDRAPVGHARARGSGLHRAAARRHLALQVVSGEFYLNLSKGTVLSGPVRVEFNNAFAEDPHDLHLARRDGTGPSYAFGTLKAGAIEAKTLDLSAGAWQLFCALPEHASRGMTARLTVTP